MKTPGGKRDLPFLKVEFEKIEKNSFTDKFYNQLEDTNWDRLAPGTAYINKFNDKKKENRKDQDDLEDKKVEEIIEQKNKDNEFKLKVNNQPLEIEKAIL